MAKEAKEVVLMSDEVSDTLRDACRDLFPIVKSSDAVFPQIKVTLPASYAECNSYHQREILNRAYTAISAFENARTAAAMAGVKGRVDTILATIKAENLDAQEKLAALPEAVRRHIPAESFRTWVGVPVYQLASAFPEGTPETDQVKYLKDLNFTLVQGKTSEGVRVRLTLKEESGPKPPKATTGGLDA